VELVELLGGRAEEIVSSALEAVRCRHLPHYEEAGAEATRARLKALFEAVLASVRTHRLDVVADHARRLARERFAAGFDLREVQSAINVLEEVIWTTAVQQLAPADLPKALGLASTVLGAGKDALAQEYVAFAGGAAPGMKLDLAALFKGTEGAGTEDLG
jgi:hypothetical protein